MRSLADQISDPQPGDTLTTPDGITRQVDRRDAENVWYRRGRSPGFEMPVEMWRKINKRATVAIKRADG